MRTSAPKRGWVYAVLATYGSDLSAADVLRREHRPGGDGPRQRALPGLADAVPGAPAERLIWPEVRLTPTHREILAGAMRQRLAQLGAQVLAIAVTERHVHLLAKTPLNRTRQWIGHAKRQAWYALRETGRKEKLWSAESRAYPITSRREQIEVYRTILELAEEGACVWSAVESRESQMTR